MIKNLLYEIALKHYEKTLEILKNKKALYELAENLKIPVDKLQEIENKKRRIIIRKIKNRKNLYALQTSQTHLKTFKKDDYAKYAQFVFIWNCYVKLLEEISKFEKEDLPIIQKHYEQEQKFLKKQQVLFSEV